MRIIKRYSNRKLYDTELSRYVKLSEVLAFVRAGVNLSVVRQADKVDVTSQTLLLALAAGSWATVPRDGIYRLIREGLAA